MKKLFSTQENEIKKVGRPSKKKEGVKYSKLTVNIPEDLLKKMKIALLTTHKHLKHNQNTFIEKSIIEYINKFS